MRVKYIGNNEHDYLTYGNIYDVSVERKNTILLVCDLGVLFYYSKEKFEIVGE